MPNTQPPANANVRAVWGPADEERLQELQNRKATIYNNGILDIKGILQTMEQAGCYSGSVAMPGTLRDALSDGPCLEALARSMAEHAQPLRDALLTFDGRDRR